MADSESRGVTHRRTTHSAQGRARSESSGKYSNILRSRQHATPIHWVTSTAREKGFEGPVHRRHECQTLCERWQQRLKALFFNFYIFYIVIVKNTYYNVITK